MRNHRLKRCSWLIVISSLYIWCGVTTDAAVRRRGVEIDAVGREGQTFDHHVSGYNSWGKK